MSLAALRSLPSGAWCADADETEGPVQASWLPEPRAVRDQVLRGTQGTAPGGGTVRSQQGLQPCVAEGQQTVPTGAPTVRGVYGTGQVRQGYGG